MTPGYQRQSPRRARTATAPAALALVLLVLTGCAPGDSAPASPEPPGRPQRGGTLIVAASSDMSGVNELLAAADTFTQSVLRLMFLNLFEEQPDFDQRPPSFTPELAESWQWSVDHTVLTLRLRRDVRWSNGEPLTARDVEWTFRAQTHPAVAWSLADSKENIAAVEALDDHTVRVRYHQRNLSQLSDLNQGAILPSAAWSELPFSEWRQNADWFLERMVTSGAFHLRSWERQEQIVLESRQGYYLPGRPLLDRVVFRIVPQKTNQVGQLLAGDLHFVDHLPASETARVGSSPGVEILTYWPRQYDFIVWNTARPLFAEAEVRRALTMAIDRQALVEALWFGHARISTSPIISSVWAHNRELEPWPYDPEESKRILAGRGWADSDGDGLLDRAGEAFSFELATNTNSAVRVDAAVMIQEQLRRIGIGARVRRLEFNTLVGKCLAHDFDAMLGGWTIDTSLELDHTFHSEAIDGGYNFGGFADPEVDRLIDEAARQSEPSAKADLLRQVQRLLHQQQPYTFLWEPQRLTGVASALRDARPNALDPLFRLEDWWLAPPG